MTDSLRDRVLAPITHGGTDRGDKLCRCSRCGRESRCTMFDDYYTLHGDDNGPLYCERCIMLAAEAAKIGADA
jgi:late competence protein required for DNA uptake (superfamily II DNA/RNA helicase)